MVDVEFGHFIEVALEVVGNECGLSLSRLEKVSVESRCLVLSNEQVLGIRFAKSVMASLNIRREVGRFKFMYKTCWQRQAR